MTLHVETRGAGAPLALLHGWGFHSAIWHRFADALATSYRVHAIDLPGHGHSQEATFGSLDDIADEVSNALPPRTMLCGWSLGGLVAQRLAQRHADKVRALALVATTPCFLERADWPHGMSSPTLEDFGRDLRDHPQRTLSDFVHLNTLGIPQARATIRDITETLATRPRATPEALDAGLALLRSADLRHEKPSDVPTVVVHGARDRIVPVGAARWLSAFAGASLVELPDSAHLPFITHSAAVVRAIEAVDA